MNRSLIYHIKERPSFLRNHTFNKMKKFTIEQGKIYDFNQNDTILNTIKIFMGQKGQLGFVLAEGLISWLGCQDLACASAMFTTVYL